MPRDYWKWWWGGFAVVFAVNAFNVVVLNLDPADSSAQIIMGISFVIWVGLVVVGWRRNQDARKTFSFWWSIAAVAVYLLFALATAFLPETAQLVTAVLWVIVWVVGGIAVIIIWLVGKSKPRTSQLSSTRACPYCAETIQNAAIKCKHCGEAVTITV